MLVQRTVPLAALRNGEVNYVIDANGDTRHADDGSDRCSRPTARAPKIRAWVQAYANRFPCLQRGRRPTASTPVAITSTPPNDDFITNYTGRVDYNLTATQKVFARFTVSHENATENANEFAGDPQTNPFLDRTYAFVLGHNWVIGSNKTNQFFLGETVENYSFPNLNNPDGSTFFTFGDGTQQSLASSLYLNPSAQGRRIPVMQIGDNFTWNKGNHTFQFGGTFEDIRPTNSTKADYTTLSRLV